MLLLSPRGAQHGAGPTGAELEGKVVVDSKVGSEAGGCRKEAHSSPCPKTGMGVQAERTSRASRAGEPREIGALVQAVQTGGGGGTLQGSCERGGWETPLKIPGSVVPASLMCVLTSSGTYPNPDLCIGGAEISRG